MQPIILIRLFPLHWMYRDRLIWHLDTEQAVMPGQVRQDPDLASKQPVRQPKAAP
jgi:hypothetical protein